MEWFFVKGLLLGFSIAAPVGPIGILCIRRTLSHGLWNGFLSGLGTATADALYGSIAAFGITLLSGFLLSQQFYFRLIGGLFLLYLGYHAFRSTPAQEAAKAASTGLIAAYVSSFFLTLANPMTILSFMAVFAGLGLGPAGDSLSAAALVSGVFAGSMIWWLLLSSVANRLRHRFGPRTMIWVNRLSGVVIIAFGMVSLAAL